MISIQEKIDQLELLANDSELLAHLTSDRDMRDHNQRLALALREAALRFRSRNAIAA
jgi:hypothetical protein